MSNSITKNTKQAEPSQGSESENIITPADFQQLAKQDESHALPGFEAEESMVRDLHSEWLRLRRTSLNIAIQLGRILAKLKLELKNASPKRHWEPYVRGCLGINPRTATNYMRLERESSTLEGLVVLRKSETISEIGIREGLDFLAKPKPSSKTNADAKPKEASKRKTAATSPPLQLGDGSRVNMESLQWADGLISRGQIESWIGQASSDSNEPERQKITARNQRAVIHIATGINRACGKAESTTALEVVESAFDAIRAILHEAQATKTQES